MRLKLPLLFVFMVTFSWSQTTKTFTTNGTFTVPAGVISINAQAWGGGGSGGGASGAGLLFGRGAAGGGGGAYVSATLSVSPGQILNAEVAGQTPGTSGGNGTSGGFSTITGYESSFLAAGGSGGGANNAGGTPLGGNGGLVSNSAGTIKFAGLNGVQGNTAALLSLLLTSGAGGGGANFGGVGGAPVGSLILGTAPGNAGSAPGGGGSGAINSAGGATQTGGAGGAGQVIITYTCPAYTITGTTASNVCATGSNESIVTVASSASSLPVGSYVVAYNRSNPAATGLTANMTVSTAGTATFIATGFTAVGNSTIVITKITSQSCSSTITTNNTATVIVSPATVGGAISGGTTINVGTTSGLLTLSGHTGSVVKWQSSVSPFTTWVDIANTNTTYTSGILNETTQFRAVVQSGTCSAANSEPTTVTVNSRPSIELSPDTSNACDDGSLTIVELPYYITTGNPVTYSIVWNSFPANNFAAITDEALPTYAFDINVPAGTAPGTYTGILTVKNAGGSTSIGRIFNLTVLAGPSITTTGIVDPVATSTSSQITSLSYSATTLNPDTYFIDWNSAANAAQLADQDYTSFSFAPGGGIINNIQIPANVPAGTYSGVLMIYNGSCRHDQNISIVIGAEAPTITLAAYTDDVCYNGSATTALLSYKDTTGDPVTYSIVWSNVWSNEQYLVNVTDAVFPDGPIIIQIPAGIPTDTYTGQLTVKNANGISSEVSIFTVTIQTQPSLVVYETTTPVCPSNNLQYTSLLYNSITGNPTSYYIDWDDTANAALLQDQPSTPFNVENEPYAIETIQVSANAQPGDYSGTLYLVNSSCSSSMPIYLFIKPVPTAPVIASITQPTYEEPTGGVLLSGLPAGNWIIEVNPSGRLVTGSSQYAAITQLEEAEYTFTVTKDGVGCPSEPSEIVDIHGPYGEGGEGFKTKDSTDNTIAVTAVNKVINVNSTSQNIDKVFVYDTSGNLIYKKNKVGDSKLVIDNLRATNQILIVKVILDDNSTKTKKVIY